MKPTFKKKRYRGIIDSAYYLISKMVTLKKETYFLSLVKSLVKSLDFCRKGTEISVLVQTSANKIAKKL